MKRACSEVAYARNEVCRRPQNKRSKLQPTLTDSAFAKLPPDILVDIHERLRPVDHPAFRRTCLGWSQALPPQQLSRRVFYRCKAICPALLDNFVLLFPTTSISLLAHPGEICQFCVAVRDCCIFTYDGLYWDKSKAACFHMNRTSLDCEQIQQECWVQSKPLQASSRPLQASSTFKPLHARCRPLPTAKPSVPFKKQHEAVKALAPFVTAVKLTPEGSCFLQHLTSLSNLSKVSLTVPQTTEKVQQAKQALAFLPKLHSLSVHAEYEETDLSGFCSFLTQLPALRELSTSTNGVRRTVAACIDQITYLSHGTGIIFEQAPKALQKVHYEMLLRKHIPLLETLVQPVQITIKSFCPLALMTLPKALQEVSLTKDFAHSRWHEKWTLHEAFVQLRQLRILRINCFPTEVLVSFKEVCLPELHTFGFSMPAEKGRRIFTGNKWLAEKWGSDARRLVIPPKQMEVFKEVMPNVKTLEFMDRKEGSLTINVPHVMDGWFLMWFPALTCIHVKLTTDLWQFRNLPLDCLVHWD